MADDVRSAPAKAQPDREATPEEFKAVQEVVLERDTDAFAAADWSLVADDFDEASFVGYAGSDDPAATWRVAYPTLASYRDEWLRQAEEMGRKGDPADIAREIRGACRVAEVRINGDRALVRKQFDGVAMGDRLLWQTYYFLRRAGERWLITGFVGYLPLNGAS
jgi:hypothetical protein